MKTAEQIADLTRLKHYGYLLNAAMAMARAVNDEAQWLIKHHEFHDTINRVIAEGIRADRRQRVSEKHMRVSDRKDQQSSE